MLDHQLRLERALPVTRYVERQFTKIALEGLAAMAIAGIARVVGHRLVAATLKLITFPTMRRSSVCSRKAASPV